MNATLLEFAACRQIAQTGRVSPAMKVSYQWRRYGTAEWMPAHEASNKSPGAWLRASIEYAAKENTNQETVFVSAAPISAVEYKWLCDHI